MNLEKHLINVNKTRQKVNGKMTVLKCKNRFSNRTITIPKSLCKELSNYRKDHKTTMYIFEKINIDSVTEWFRKWQTKNNIPKIRFHDLRHTHATILLENGIDIKTISNRLGHSNVGTTLNIYTHVTKELDNKASDIFE